MSAENQSQAKSSKLEFDGEGSNRMDYLNFLSNINSRVPSIDSNSIQIDFTTILQQEYVVLGVKTPRTVAILLLHPKEQKVELKMQIDTEDQPKSHVSCFKFDRNSSQKDIKELKVFVGYNTGAIILYRVNQNEILKRLNQSDRLQKQRTFDIIFPKRVIKIVLPAKNYKNNQQALALFEDGYLVEYQLTLKQTDPVILEEMYNALMKASFSEIKRYNSVQIQQATQLQNQIQHFSFESLNDGEFTHIQAINLKGFSPSVIYRFECMSMNEAEILPFNPLDHITQVSQAKESEIMLLAFTALDGYFRILEMRERRPIFSFRSDFGGFSSFSFNKSYSMVCLAGQDDTTYVVSFEKKIVWFKLFGHNSFISRSVFQEDQNVFRIISGSQDGYISITQIDSYILQNLKENKSEKVKNRLIAHSTPETLNVQVQNKLLTNLDGICYLGYVSGFLATVNFDGCITIFGFQNYEMLMQQQQQ